MATSMYNFDTDGRSWVATLGALITIMASLIGFFTQQLAQFHDCLQVDFDVEVGVKRTNAYNASGLTNDEMDNTAYTMRAAIGTAILRPLEDYDQDLIYGGCSSSGLCNFSSGFSTLGFFHQCRNITDQTRTEKHPRPAVNDFDVWLNHTNDAWTNITLPVENIGRKAVLSTGTFVRPFDGLFDHITSLDVNMIYRSNITDMSYEALFCQFFPGIGTYSIGNLGQHHGVMTPISYNALALPGTNVTNEERQTTFKQVMPMLLMNGTRMPCPSQKHPAPGFVSASESDFITIPNITQQYNSNKGEVRYFSEECVYSFGHQAMMELAQIFFDIFDSQTLRWGGQYGASEGSAYLSQMFREGNISWPTIDLMFKNIASAMSTFVRTHGVDGLSEPFQGSKLYFATCVRVMWLWICFPAALIVLLVLFLFFVSMQNRDMESDGLWKSSVLAMLFCEMDDLFGDEDKCMCKRDMQGIAETTSVRLDSSGLRLRGVAC
ncbi:hypothetical protein NX059_003314 [Plenodomus lindquistii]|nr:hypothetical protein NX059_003314 [Plenodomus lindquistii]